jgi:hypothetical protein
MLYVKENGNIKLTRGDTAYLTFPMTTSTGEEYVMQAGDKLELTVRETVEIENALIHKVVMGANEFYIEPSDTAGLAFGKYKYDVQLTTADGDVFTVTPVREFEVLGEVTR